MRRWWLATALAAAAGCSKQTSAPVPCDTSGIRLLAFASDRRQAAGHDQIWLYDLDAQGFHLLRNLASPSAVDSTPALSPDGELIAFTRADTTDPARTRIMIYARAACGFVSRPVLDTGHERDPAFTGDGLRLAFARDTLGHWRLRLLNSGGSLAPIGHLGDPQGYDDWAPAPSQDGSRIAFVSNRANPQLPVPPGGPHVYVYDVAGDTLVATPGLDSLGADVDPSLTPDGRWLCFASNRAGGKGGFDLYLYDLGARTLVRLDNANSDQDERRPSLRAAATGLAFQSARAGGGGQFDVWLYSLGAAAPYQLPEMPSPGNDLQPSVVWP